MNVVQVQRLLGHHSPAFTLAKYVHTMPDDLPDPDFMDDVVAAEKVSAPVAATHTDTGRDVEDVGVVEKGV